MSDKMFPIQGQGRKAGTRWYVSWKMAEEAYEVYKFHYGSDQSLERLAKRGGFGLLELQWLLEGKIYEQARKQGFKK